ncbi:hypothetical protein RRG08_040192 [Elysia crispata]|uniref:Uncharacterized protein n=1 Tax=Elysia crispata TaxID=231223 RepID=A0AAE0XXB5_9GAST|nr:hypothetical protein RRG08_040192 [Elysia crispata]
MARAAPGRGANEVKGSFVSGHRALRNRWTCWAIWGRGYPEDNGVVFPRRGGFVHFKCKAVPNGWFSH